MIKLIPYHCKDDQVFGCDAFTMLVPEGWVVQGGLKWRMHATMPAAIELTVRSQDGLCEFSFLPSVPYFYNKSPFGFFAQEASYYMGNEVRKPVYQYFTYLEKYILPKCGFRYRVVSAKPSQEIYQALQSENQAAFGCKMTIDAGRAHMEYAHEGMLFEGDLSCGIVTTEMPYMQTAWIADKMVSTRMPKGQYQEMSGVFDMMLKSFKFQLQWFNYYYAFVNSLTQIVLQDIFNAGRISHIISTTSNQVSDIVRSSYERQQATYERTFTNFSEGIRGVNSYYDPYKGYPVEFPVDYRYIYANPLGEYIMTNDPNYNPNIGSNLNWTKL